jgi:hypothetical protein
MSVLISELTDGLHQVEHEPWGPLLSRLLCERHVAHIKIKKIIFQYTRERCQPSAE